VAQRRQRHRLHVVGRDELAPGEERRGARGAHQRDAAARAGADRGARPGARRAHQVHRVLEDLVVHAHRGGGALQREHGGRIDERLHRIDLQPLANAPGGDLAHQADFLRHRRIVDADLEQEAVELRLGQRVGAFLLDRVLRGEHHEGRRERVRLALDGDLLLLHHFEERGLRFRGRPIDLVGEQQVGEHRPAARREGARARVVERVPGDVGGHQVGGELDAREFPGEGARKRLHQQRLAQPRHALDQHVARGEQRGERLLEDFGLADQRTADLRTHAGGELDGALRGDGLHGCFAHVDLREKRAPGRRARRSCSDCSSATRRVNSCGSVLGGAPKARSNSAAGSAKSEARRAWRAAGSSDAISGCARVTRARHASRADSSSRPASPACQ
jgi:hypothetical protein